MTDENPFQVPLPSSFQLGSLNSAMNSLIKHFAWDLGERYDRALSNEPHPLGPQWLKNLNKVRNQNHKLHDPSFVFSEPELHHQSPVWRALGERNAQRQKLLFRCRKTRNSWEHETADQTKGTFKQGVLHIRDAAREFDARSTADACAALLDRFEQLQAAGGELPGDADIASQLKEMMAQAQSEAEAARQELQRLRANAAANGAAHEQLQRQLEKQEELLEAAAQQEKSLREQFYLALQQERIRILEPSPSLVPGQDWTGPLPTRTLSLNPYMTDLLDASRGVMLSDELGPVAKAAAARWLSLMPAGGQVHLTPAGHAAGNVLGRFIYLGRLDDELAGLPPEEVDLGGTSSFEVLQDGLLLNLETGERVMAAALKSHTHAAVGSRVRVTASQHAFALDAGQLRDLGLVELTPSGDQCDADAESSC